MTPTEFCAGYPPSADAAGGQKITIGIAQFALPVIRSPECQFILPLDSIVADGIVPGSI
jgi:hypothetical protein